LEKTYPETVKEWRLPKKLSRSDQALFLPTLREVGKKIHGEYQHLTNSSKEAVTIRF